MPVITSKQDKKEVKRDAHGRIMPGFTANPGGRPSGPSKALIDIQNAILEFEQEKGVPYWKAATLIAMKLAHGGNTSLLGKILDKFIPTQIQGEGFSDTHVVINKTIIEKIKLLDHEQVRMSLDAD